MNLTVRHRVSRRFVSLACSLLGLSCVSHSQELEMPGYGAIACRQGGDSTSRGCGREKSVQFEGENGPTKILHGHEVARGKYPWVVAVARMQPGGKFRVYCGGSVVASTWILTAAHCQTKVGDYVLVGRQDLNSNAGKPFKIDRLMNAVPHYQTASKASDALLLHIDTPTEVKPIVLNEDTVIEESGDAQLVIAGWGTTSYLGRPSSVLLEAAVHTIQLQGCQSRYDHSKRTIPSTSFCATGEAVADACQGDSGGSAFRHDDSSDTYQLVGIVSWGIGCGDDAYPGIYTRASWVSTWIKPIIKKM
jgi:secreted trypsin-like serine protease